MDTRVEGCVFGAVLSFLAKSKRHHEQVEQAMEEEKDARVRWRQSSQRG